MNNNILLGKEKWGPIAWNLIHYFSIHSNNNECMKIIILTFGYIIPCETCKKHYHFLINTILPLNDQHYSKKYFIKYLFHIHNLINEDLNKKSISFNKALKDNSTMNDQKILLFIKIIYQQFNYKKMSCTEFDKIYNFFICFVKLYPNKKINLVLNKEIQSSHFKEANTPLTFRKWILNDFSNLKIIKNINKNIFIEK
jgi:hypothetical protein